LNKKLGQRTIKFETMPYIKGYAAVAGKAEKEGPLGAYFDLTFDDDLWEEKTWELTERKMFLNAVKMAVARADLTMQEIDFLFGGDLLNQIITAGFAARELSVPFIGLYGACSTMSESILAGSVFLEGGFADNVACATASHMATAERQYRYPLELGTPKTPTSQITVTGSGSVVLSSTGNPGMPRVTHATTGRVIDMGITDANDMGSAMVPAALETILTHFEDTGRNPDYYDLVITGDLGIFGSSTMVRKAGEQGADLSHKHVDCGAEIFKGKKNIYSGGSGCGCGGSVLTGYYLKKMQEGKLKKILFVATGALLSPTSTLQGETIPSIAHAIAIETEV
jgi:stage V sporulation protein AD